MTILSGPTIWNPGVQHVRWAEQELPQLCWADMPSTLHPLSARSCYELSTTTIGLCPKHYEEIVSHD